MRALRRHSATATFVAGFLFDFLTMRRIDAWTDLGFQLGYLAGLTGLLVLQQREESGQWMPGRFTARVWQYNVEALHFLYGGLLSAYVVLYFRSSTGAQPVVFLVLLIAVMVVNEVPHVRRAGYRLRLGLYGFCVLSFLTYFIPILLGRMGGWVFGLSLVSSAAIVWVMASWLTRAMPNSTLAPVRLFAPAAGVLLLIGVLYVGRLIPPVPMSVQFHGIYHDVRRDDAGFTLIYEAPALNEFWRRDSRPFSQRGGDRLHYFVRVFAPSGFRHRVMIRWEVYDAGRNTWITTDRIALDVTGGRAEGFRGTTVKSTFMPGRWRVTTETEDGRAIARLSFRVRQDGETGERRWRTARA